MGIKGIVAVLAVVQLAGAVDHPVGGSGAWDASGTSYNTWSAKQKIVQGDTLSFKYAPSHDVVEVTKAGYDACSGSNPIKSYTGGATTVKLTAPGKRYFICSVPGHCAAGMKLEVTVAAGGGATAPAPAKSNKPRHQRSVAPASAPAMAPEAPSSSVPSSTTDVSSPTAAPAPKSSDATSIGVLGAAKAALAVGMALALAI